MACSRSSCAQADEGLEGGVFQRGAEDGRQQIRHVLPFALARENERQGRARERVLRVLIKGLARQGFGFGEVGRLTRLVQRSSRTAKGLRISSQFRASEIFCSSAWVPLAAVLDSLSSFVV